MRHTSPQPNFGPSGFGPPPPPGALDIAAEEIYDEITEVLTATATRKRRIRRNLCTTFRVGVEHADDLMLALLYTTPRALVVEDIPLAGSGAATGVGAGATGSSRQGFGDNEMIALAAALRNNATLLAVAFRRLRVTERGIAAVCSALEAHPLVRHVDLVGTALHGAGCWDAVLALVQRNPQILKVELAGTGAPAGVVSVVDEACARNALSHADPRYVVVPTPTPAVVAPLPPTKRSLPPLPAPPPMSLFDALNAAIDALGDRMRYHRETQRRMEEVAARWAAMAMGAAAPAPSRQHPPPPQSQRTSPATEAHGAETSINPPPTAASATDVGTRDAAAGEDEPVDHTTLPDSWAEANDIAFEREAQRNAGRVTTIPTSTPAVKPSAVSGAATTAASSSRADDFEICRDYIAARCEYGSRCRYAHPGAPPAPPTPKPYVPVLTAEERRNAAARSRASLAAVAQEVRERQLRALRGEPLPPASTSAAGQNAHNEPPARPSASDRPGRDGVATANRSGSAASTSSATSFTTDGSRSSLDSSRSAASDASDGTDATTSSDEDSAASASRDGRRRGGTRYRHPRRRSKPAPTAEGPLLDPVVVGVALVSCLAIVAAALFSRRRHAAS
jgi:hypothetical protein